MITRRSFFGIAALASSAIPVLAHHGWGGNEDKEFEISGTVVSSVSLAGPHVTMKMKDDKGNVWDLTLAPPFMTERAGLKDGSFAIWKGPIVGSDGKEVLKKDQVADDAFLGGIKFYVKGVEGKVPAGN